MKLTTAHPFILALLGFVLIHLSPVMGQTTETKVKKIPFHGKLQAVDTSANTVTLAGKKATRVFHLTAETKVIDGSGNPTTLASAVVGEDVGGSYTKDASGNMMLNSLRLGAKAGSKAAAAEAGEAPAPAPAAAESTPSPAPAPAPAAAAPAPETTSTTPAAADTTKVKKQRFSGKVVSVNAGANTLVVHGKTDQTFTVTASTKITGAAGLSAITAGQKVSGSYEKSADGTTMTLATLKVTN
jgi:hypothetical protein